MKFCCLMVFFINLKLKWHDEENRDDGDEGSIYMSQTIFEAGGSYDLLQLGKNPAFKKV